MRLVTYKFSGTFRICARNLSLGLSRNRTTDGDVVFGKVVLGEEPEVSVLKEWLISAAKSLREARIYKADKPGIKLFRSTRIGEAERQGILPTSIEGLIAYVGFS